MKNALYFLFSVIGGLCLPLHSRSVASAIPPPVLSRAVEDCTRECVANIIPTTTGSHWTAHPGSPTNGLGTPSCGHCEPCVGNGVIIHTGTDCYSFNVPDGFGSGCGDFLVGGFLSNGCGGSPASVDGSCPSGTAAVIQTCECTF